MKDINYGNFCVGVGTKENILVMLSLEQAVESYKNLTDEGKWLGLNGRSLQFVNNNTKDGKDQMNKSYKQEIYEGFNLNWIEKERLNVIYETLSEKFNLTKNQRHKQYIEAKTKKTKENLKFMNFDEDEVEKLKTEIKSAKEELDYEIYNCDEIVNDYSAVVEVILSAYTTKYLKRKFTCIVTELKEDEFDKLNEIEKMEKFNSALVFMNKELNLFLSLSNLDEELYKFRVVLYNTNVCLMMMHKNSYKK